MIQKFIEIEPYINMSQHIPAHKMGYLEFGNPDNKNVIVCAHGLTRNSHDFDKIATVLSNNFRVISIDYPGRGVSDVFSNKEHYNYPVYIQDTVLFLKKLAIDRCIWLGTSMGGIIGMVLASRYPDLVKAMIINDVGPFIPSALLVKIALYAGQRHTFIDLIAAKQYLKLIYNQFAISNEEDWDHMTKYSFIKTLDGQYKMNYDPDLVYGMLNNTSKVKDVDIWAIWNGISCKLLVIHGVKSDVLSQSTLDKMKKTRGFDIFDVDYAGHAPSLMSQDQISYIVAWTKALET